MTDLFIGAMIQTAGVRGAAWLTRRAWGDGAHTAAIWVLWPFYALVSLAALARRR